MPKPNELRTGRRAIETQPRHLEEREVGEQPEMVAAAPELRRPFLLGVRLVIPLRAQILAVSVAALGGIERGKAVDLSRSVADDAQRDLPRAVPIAGVYRAEERETLVDEGTDGELGEDIVASVVVRILERAVAVIELGGQQGLRPRQRHGSAEHVALGVEVAALGEGKVLAELVLGLELQRAGSVEITQLTKYGPLKSCIVSTVSGIR